MSETEPTENRKLAELIEAIVEVMPVLAEHFEFVRIDRKQSYFRLCNMLDKLKAENKIKL